VRWQQQTRQIQYLYNSQHPRSTGAARPRLGAPGGTSVCGEIFQDPGISVPWLAVLCTADPGTPGEAQVTTQEINCSVEMVGPAAFQVGIEPDQALPRSAGLVPLLRHAHRETLLLWVVFSKTFSKVEPLSHRNQGATRFWGSLQSMYCS